MDTIKKFFKQNLYLFLGIIIGVYISSILQDSLDIECHKTSELQRNETNEQILKSFNKSMPLINVPRKPSESKKKVIRPRYYSTELGIRDKMFVGIFTSEEKVNTQAIHINKTIGHLADKIKFFITAQYKLKSKFNLTGLVGFTDSRSKYRPFQVVKYVGDSFAEDYDYYFFANDYTFINIHKLKDAVKKISVSMHVYLGTKVADSSYCNFDAGILISNSVLRAMRNHLDWCIINSVSDDNSENFGRCVYHSKGLNCQDSIQGISIDTFKLRHFELNEHLLKLTDDKRFSKALTVYPVIQKEDFYLLNTYFLRQRLTSIKNNIDKLSTLVKGSWPAGQRTGAKPATRFDLQKQHYFNISHVFLPDDFTAVREHTDAELKDIMYLIDEIKAKTNKTHNNLLYRRLINGYKKFDLSRGADYIFDLGFRDKTTGKEITKRFEVCKPLGNVEFVQVPYVTENSRVTILFPVQETEIDLAMEFLKKFTHIMDHKEKTILMLVLLYQYNSESKGDHDVFQKVKLFVTTASNKYKNDDTKIGWVSIRLPESKKLIYVEDYPSLNFAIVDLSLKKVGLESLVLVLDSHCNITVDFLNRVRMNTIVNFQIFNPIPFRQYDPRITGVKTLDVLKTVGHFDKEEYKYISFYGKDYVVARKKFQHIMPLIRIDNDISNIITPELQNTGNIFEMFIKYGEELHCMRATDFNLKILYHDVKNVSRTDWFLGSKAQLAKLLLTKHSEIPELL